MRVAIVITSLYESGPQLGSLSAWTDDTERLAERLGEPDAGYEIEILSAEKGLADELGRVVERCSPDDELFVYFGGYAVLSAQRGAALLLDGARPGALAISKLRTAFGAHAGGVLFVVDALTYLDPGKSWAEFAGLLGSELAGGALSVLVAARAPDVAPGDALVSRALLGAIDVLGRTSNGAVSAADLCSVLEADLGLRRRLGCFSYYAGAVAPWVLQPPQAQRPPPPPTFSLPSFHAPGPELGVRSELPRPALVPPPEPRPRRSEPGPSRPPSGGATPASSFLDRLSRGAHGTPLPEPVAPPVADAHGRFEADDNEVTRVDHELSRMVPDSGQPAQALSEPAEQWSEPTPTHSDVFTRPSGLGDDFDDATLPKLDVDPLLQARRASAAPTPPETTVPDAAPSEALPSLESEADDEQVATPRPQAAPAPEPDDEVPTPRPVAPAPPADVNASSALAHGDQLLAAGDHQGAIEEFKRVLMVLGGERSLQRSEIYVRLGDAARALSRGAVALNNYDKALAIDPTNAAALASAAELLSENRDFERLAEFYRRRFDALDDPAERGELLERIASLWLDQAGNLERGIEALEHWLVHVPEQPTALARLVEAEQQLGRQREALEAQLRLVELYPGDPARQAALLGQAARTAYETLNDPEQALALAERALALDGGARQALGLVETLLDKAGEIGRLSELYETLLGQTADGPAALELCLKLGRLAQTKLGDLQTAVAAYERAIQIDGGDPSLRLLLADLYVELGALEQAAVHCQAAALALPRDADVFRRARAVFERAGDRDRAWHAACVIDYLGEADVNESLAAAEHRAEGLIAAQDTLHDEDWWSGALLPELDPGLMALVAAIAAPALEIELPRVGKRRGLPALQPEQRHDLEKSTITLGKSLLWTSRLIGVSTPELYIVPELDPELVLVPGTEPRCIASKALASGLSLPELAFVWGRQLSLLRPELGLLVAFPEPEQAAELFEACLVVAQVGSGRRANANAKRLAGALGKRLDERRLGALVGPFADRDPLELAASWQRSAELGCVRTGLLACGDLGTALGVLSRVPGPCRLPEEQQVDRLLAYAVSSEYAELRRRLGVALP